jgi:pSer/pThr/pTyr-binding forkhead associated (FHA) protein
VARLTGLAVQVAGEDIPRVFTGRFVIGRDVSWAAINLTDDTSVSPHHAECLPLPDGMWIIEDNGSTNGTWAGNVRIFKAQVGNGERLRVGHTILTFTSQPCYEVAGV